MVTKMMNRLLATVMAIAVSSGLAAHAAQASRAELPRLPRVSVGLKLPASITLPTALVQTFTENAADGPKPVLGTLAAPAAKPVSKPAALQHPRQSGSSSVSDHNSKDSKAAEQKSKDSAEHDQHRSPEGASHKD